MTVPQPFTDSYHTPELSQWDRLLVSKLERPILQALKAATSGLAQLAFRHVFVVEELFEEFIAGNHDGTGRSNLEYSGGEAGEEAPDTLLPQDVLHDLFVGPRQSCVHKHDVLLAELNLLGRLDNVERKGDGAGHCASHPTADERDVERVRVAVGRGVQRLDPLVQRPVKRGEWHVPEQGGCVTAPESYDSTSFHQLLDA